MLCSTLLVSFPRFLPPLVLPQIPGYRLARMLRNCGRAVNLGEMSKQCGGRLPAYAQTRYSRNLCANIPFGLEDCLLQMRLKGLMILMCAKFTNSRLLGVMYRNSPCSPKFAVFSARCLRDSLSGVPGAGHVFSEGEDHLAFSASYPNRRLLRLLQWGKNKSFCGALAEI